MKQVRVGVIGVGYLGKFHAEKYAALPQAELVGVVDTDAAASRELGERLQVPSYNNCQALFDIVDAVSIVVPTEHHHAIARECLDHGIDVLVEKPMTTTLAEADDLIQAAQTNSRILQVGHLERFNAALLSLDGILQTPMFIESHRLAPFKDRGTDVDVILDIMIHDIDIILNITSSPVKSIQAVGVPVVSSKNNDIANVRLEFESGCVANVTASRISAKEMRKIRVFQQDAYLSIDFAAQQVEVYKKFDGGADYDSPQIMYDLIDITQGDSLKAEIESFLQAVQTRSLPTVPGEAGRNALKVALEIVAQIDTKKTTLKI
ncbi:MAG: Gfo/Idh/MocA family oxidoreductase [Deltaproteobacteria bacterium]|nr:Gfo/Idh/MocA family oxidoreductase [Deltaproteobacteria bacterium]